jgi:hypothetical protein
VPNHHSLSPDRRELLVATVLLPFLGQAAPAMIPDAPDRPRPAGAEGFDFLHGSWTVRHRKLARRLAGSNDWLEFGGIMTCRPLLGGQGNIDENRLDDPSGAYLAVTLRLFDAATRTWSIWWADPRFSLLSLDPPVQGRFDGGQGLFLSENMFEGRPIVTRFRWFGIEPDQARWEQAFSPDGGASWEVNWIMRFDRNGA